ncbi:MAG: hypothetical protein KGQ41_07015 [Alphaproteobacteria bacterium]|nr:hypothetical protein [Alphaproteobacteria bacterium]
MDTHASGKETGLKGHFIALVRNIAKTLAAPREYYADIELGNNTTLTITETSYGANRWNMLLWHQRPLLDEADLSDPRTHFFAREPRGTLEVETLHAGLKSDEVLKHLAPMVNAKTLDSVRDFFTTLDRGHDNSPRFTPS